VAGLALALLQAQSSDSPAPAAVADFAAFMLLAFARNSVGTTADALAALSQETLRLGFGENATAAVGSGGAVALSPAATGSVLAACAAAAVRASPQVVAAVHAAACERAAAATSAGDAARAGSALTLLQLLAEEAARAAATSGQLPHGPAAARPHAAHTLALLASLLPAWAAHSPDSSSSSSSSSGVRVAAWRCLRGWAACVSLAEAGAAQGLVAATCGALGTVESPPEAEALADAWLQLLPGAEGEGEEEGEADEEGLPADVMAALATALGGQEGRLVAAEW
jgi:hypothetical protein